MTEAPLLPPAALGMEACAAGTLVAPLAPIRCEIPRDIGLGKEAPQHRTAKPPTTSGVGLVGRTVPHLSTEEAIMVALKLRKFCVRRAGCVDKCELRCPVFAGDRERRS